MKLVLSAAVSIVLLMACNKNNDNPNALNEQDKTFLKQVYQANKNEIATGQEALNKSSNALVRDFAEEAVQFYSAAQTDLREVLKKLNFNLDTMNIITEAPLFSDLNGYSFDTSYMRSRIITHRISLGIYQKEFNEGNQTYVRHFYVNKYIDDITKYYLRADSISRAL